MLNIKIICTGKIKESYLREACEEYKKRLSRYAGLEICELAEASLSENPSSSQIELCLKKEGEQILNQIPKDAFVFALCIEGKELSSEELSSKLEELALMGRGKICFVIGSSFGLCDEVKNRADIKLSFSKMTFPHQLFRVLLLEQIYRALSITNNSKYHK